MLSVARKEFRGGKQVHYSFACLIKTKHVAGNQSSKIANPKVACSAWLIHYAGLQNSETNLTVYRCME